MQFLTDGVLAQPSLEAAERNRDPSQLLAHVIVQVSRKTRALGILRRDQPSGQMLNLSMTLLQCSGVLSRVRSSALRRSVMSTSQPMYPARLPSAPYFGTPDANNHRYLPSANAVIHEEWSARFERGLIVLRQRSTSSGWTLSNQPSFDSCSSVRPVNSAQVVFEVVERRVGSGCPA